MGLQIKQFIRQLSDLLIKQLIDQLIGQLR